MAKFNHQPFDDWLLSEEALSADQDAALQAHLQSCEQCSQLLSAWKEIELEISSASTLSPLPGFTARFQENLAAQRARREYVQTLLFLSFCLVGAGVLLITLGILVWPVVRSPYPLLLALGYEAASAFAFASSAVSLTGTIFRTVGGIVPPILWVGLVVIAGSMLTVWIFVLRRFAYSRRFIQ
jgi:anti-sigma factor RsiW